MVWSAKPKSPLFRTPRRIANKSQTPTSLWFTTPMYPNFSFKSSYNTFGLFSPSYMFTANHRTLGDWVLVTASHRGSDRGNMAGFWSLGSCRIMHLCLKLPLLSYNAKEKKTITLRQTKIPMENQRITMWIRKSMNINYKRTMFNSYVKFQRVLELTHLYTLLWNRIDTCLHLFLHNFGDFSKQCLVWAGRSFRASVFSMQLAAQRDKNMLMSLTQPHKVRVF